jgi:hypothetical protein
MLRNGEDAAMRKTLRSSATEAVRRRLPEAAAGSVRAENSPTATGLQAELAELECLSLDDLRLRWRKRRWQCSERHVRNLIATGDLPAFRLGGKAERLEIETMAAACVLASQQTTPESADRQSFDRPT